MIRIDTSLQKEQYVYDHREWSTSYLIIVACLCFFLVYIVVLDRGKWYLFPFFLPLLLQLTLGCSLRASVTTLNVTLLAGFFSQRTIFYYEIVSITPRNNLKFIELHRPLSFKGRYFQIGFSREPAFVINLRNNDFCLIQCKRAEDILAAIKKAQPLIEIDNQT